MGYNRILKLSNFQVRLYLFVWKPRWRRMKQGSAGTSPRRTLQQLPVNNLSILSIFLKKIFKIFLLGCLIPDPTTLSHGALSDQQHNSQRN